MPYADLAGGHGARLTLYKREPATFAAGQLQLSRIASFMEPGLYVGSFLIACISPLLQKPQKLHVFPGAQRPVEDLDSTLHLELVRRLSSCSRIFCGCQCCFLSIHMQSHFIYAMGFKGFIASSILFSQMQLGPCFKTILQKG